ncbi:MAG: magnesium/cobalt transporter CorA [Phycisphaerales bacterium]|nr:MAG: magnesium/cobalt transporter CorA [Phycisphaerales bacterium]
MAKVKAKRRLRIPVIRRRQPPGTRPGEIALDPEAPRPVITAMAYGPEGELIETCIEDPEQIKPLLEQRSVVWINVDGLGDVEVLRKLGEMFQIHRLALEDVSNVHQRAKMEPYDEHLFVVARMVHFQKHLRTEQLSMFIGEKYLLTFQEFRGDSFDMVRQRIRDGRPQMRKGGPSYLAYALLDALIDGYFPVLEMYGEKTETLEDEVSLNPHEALIHRIHAIKRDLIALRRAMWPHREAINALMRDESRFIAEETRVYLRDCYDHAIQIVDLIETYRELAGGLLDVYLSSISNRMNEVMKVLTIFAAIFIPLTFMAGLYGMNFEHMPELGLPWAYPVFLCLLVVVAVIMLILFRRKGWLGGGGRKSRGEENAAGSDTVENS